MPLRRKVLFAFTGWHNACPDCPGTGAGGLELKNEGTPPRRRVLFALTGRRTACLNWPTLHIRRLRLGASEMVHTKQLRDETAKADMWTRALSNQQANDLSKVRAARTGKMQPKGRAAAWAA